MSEYVRHKGKLKKISADYEDFAMREVRDSELEEYYSSWLECLLDTCREQYIMINKELFSIENEEQSPEEDFYRLTENSDGTYTYEVQFYDGGSDLTEAIEKCFK